METERILQSEWLKKGRELEELEQIEGERVRRLNRHHQQEIKQQIAEKEEKVKTENRKSREELIAMEDAARREDLVFEAYVNERLRQQIEKGRAVEAAKQAIKQEQTRRLRAGERLQY